MKNLAKQVEFKTRNITMLCPENDFTYPPPRTDVKVSNNGEITVHIEQE